MTDSWGLCGCQDACDPRDHCTLASDWSSPRMWPSDWLLVASIDLDCRHCQAPDTQGRMLGCTKENEKEGETGLIKKLKFQIEIDQSKILRLRNFRHRNS